MNISDLIQHSKSLGAVMRVVGDKLELVAPSGALSPFVIKQIEANKTRLKLYICLDESSIELYGLKLDDVIQIMDDVDWNQALETPEIVQVYAHLIASNQGKNPPPLSKDIGVLKEYLVCSNV